MANVFLCPGTSLCQISPRLFELDRYIPIETKTSAPITTFRRTPIRFESCCCPAVGFCRKMSRILPQSTRGTYGRTDERTDENFRDGNSRLIPSPNSRPIVTIISAANSHLSARQFVYFRYMLTFPVCSIEDDDDGSERSTIHQTHY